MVIIIIIIIIIIIKFHTFSLVITFISSCPCLGCGSSGCGCVSSGCASSGFWCGLTGLCKI